MLSKKSSLSQLILRIVFSTDHPDDKKYKPNLFQLLTDSAAAYVVELYDTGLNGKQWFRILRIKENKRTHDFIIDNFENNTIIIENDRSQYCLAKFDSIESLIGMFKDVKLFRKYTRPKVRSRYLPVLNSKLTVNELFAKAKLISKKSSGFVPGSIQMSKTNPKQIPLSTLNEIFKRFKDDAQDKRSTRAVSYDDQTMATLQKLHDTIKRKAR